MQTVSAKEREGKKKEREELLKRLSDIQKEQSQKSSVAIFGKLAKIQ